MSYFFAGFRGFKIRVGHEVLGCGVEEADFLAVFFDNNDALLEAVKELVVAFTQQFCLDEHKSNFVDKALNATNS